MRTAALLAALSLGVAPAALGAPAAAPADPVDLGGTPVESPSTDPGNPTELAAGLWSDTLGAGETADATHQYSYDRTGDDTTVHVGVVATAAARSATRWRSRSTHRRTTCDSDTTRPPTPSPRRRSGRDHASARTQPDRNSACLTARTSSRSPSAGATQQREGDLPVAIKVVEEAPLTDRSTGPAAVPGGAEPAFRKLPGSPPRPGVTGAASFDGRAAAEDGHARATPPPRARPGVYRVALDWGQTLAVRAGRAGDGRRAQLEETGGLRARRAGPCSTRCARLLDTIRTGTRPAALDGEEPLRLSDAAGPVRFLSRYGPAPDVPARRLLGGGLRRAEPDGTDDRGLRHRLQLTVAAQGDGDGRADVLHHRRLHEAVPGRRGRLLHGGVRQPGAAGRGRGRLRHPALRGARARALRAGLLRAGRAAAAPPLSPTRRRPSVGGARPSRRAPRTRSGGRRSR